MPLPRHVEGEALQRALGVLNRGGTRAEVRESIRASTGRGIGNNGIAEIRELHRQLLRSQGVLVLRHGKRPDLTPVINARGDIQVQKLEKKRRLPRSRRPLPPNLPGLRVAVTRLLTRVDNQGRPLERVIERIVGSSRSEIMAGIARARTDDIGTPIEDVSGMRTPPPDETLRVEVLL